LPFKFANGAIVTHPLLPRHAAIAGAVVLLSLTPAFAAETPTPQELLHATTSGSYLAARHAGVERDSATAAAYYLNVLKADPHNADLLSRTFLSVLSEGDIDEAGRLADRLVQVDHNDRIARLVLGVRALKQKQYAAARQNFATSSPVRIGTPSSRICMPASSSMSPTTRRTPASATSAPTRPTRWRCAPSRPTAVICRATAARKMR
jgi:hypothetical protein